MNRTGQLNIQRNIFLEREELTNFQDFMRNSTSRFLFANSTEKYGIVRNQSLGDRDFRITNGSAAGTVRTDYPQATDISYAVDKDLNLMRGEYFDNFPIPEPNKYYWLLMRYAQVRAEMGILVDVSADGEVTLASGSATFSDILRGQLTNKPTKVRFYKENADGSISTAQNSGVYNVVSISGETFIIQGDSFVSDTNCRLVVVGSYTLGTSLTNEQKDGVYIYDWVEYEMVEEIGSDSAPNISIVGETVNKDYFWLARCYYNDGTGVTTVEDKRDDVDGYWRINLGDILVDLTGKADLNAGNLTVANIKSWITRLSVFRTDTITNPDNITDAGYYYLQVDGQSGYLTMYTYNNRQAYQQFVVDNFTETTDDLIIKQRTYGGGGWGDWESIYPYKDATEAAKGISQIATQAEVNTGTNDTKFVTPATRGVIDYRDAAETESIKKMRTKIVEIGAWDMDATGSANVNHGLSGSQVANSVIEGVTIINDSGETYSLLDEMPIYGGVSILLTREEGGFFDSINFDNPTMNRGFIKISYWE